MIGAVGGHRGPSGAIGGHRGPSGAIGGRRGHRGPSRAVRGRPGAIGAILGPSGELFTGQYCTKYECFEIFIFRNKFYEIAKFRYFRENFEISK